MLVLGSRGPGVLTGLLVASAALGVVAHAARPVVLVRAGKEAGGKRVQCDERSPTVHPSYGAVVLGIDLGHPCDEVVAFAFDAASRRETRLHVVHARRGPSLLSLGLGEIGLVQEPRREEEWRGFLDAVL
ncbi:hypothetical protein [Streptomyces sp. NBC_00191]|uniref:hypothetical protein n=1 Tax=Streptomyces sp. NBC_00191 TaxID=2975674 RepID=UPI0038685E92